MSCGRKLPDAFPPLANPCARCLRAEGKMKPLEADPPEIRGRGSRALSMAARTPAPAGTPNVLVVCLDSLRADHVTPEIMPNLCELLSRGHRFEGVRAPMGWTLPSVGAMLYGDDAALTRGAVGMVGQPSIAGRLGGTHATGAFLGGAIFAVAEALWLFRDFDSVFSSSDGDHGAGWPISRMLSEFRSWRDKVRSPWLAYLHCLEPHDPYLPGDWYGEWEKPPFPHPMLQAGSIRGVIDIATGRLQASSAAGEYLRRRYAAYCAAADAALAPLWRELPADTAIIVVSDHGEGMGEGGIWHHGDKPAFQQPEILSVLFGIVAPGGMAEVGPVTANRQLWEVIEACLPRVESDEAAVTQKLREVGYLG